MKKNLFVVVNLALLFCGAALLLAKAPQSPDAREITLSGKEQGWPVLRLPPIALTNGDFLVCVGNTVYMLDGNGKQRWKYENEALTSKPAFNSQVNEIAVVMYDLQGVRLDATTGKLKWKSNAVGKGLFAAVSAYKDGFLVVVDMSGYKNNEDRNPKDRLEYWGKSEKDYWHVDFPQGAELVVAGQRVYALRRAEDRAYLQEVKIPGSNRAS